METKVTLLSWTQDPIKTLYAVWYASREEGEPIRIPSTIDANDPKVIEVFEKAASSELPVADCLNFVFLMENVSIALREQMVRHRVGIRFDDRVGIDIIPDLGQSSWWSQGFRILDMSKFYQHDKFSTPDSIKNAPKEVQLAYNDNMIQNERTYAYLVSAGIPREDARNVLPLAASHSITWIINLSALKHLLSKRSCCIPQLGLWKPVIEGMVEELSTKIHPLFRKLVTPPCIKNEKFNECLFKFDNEKRIKGEDEPPPCSLYIYNHDKQYMNPFELKVKLGDSRYARYVEMTNKFSAFWERDPWTGISLTGAEEITDSKKEGWS